MFESLFQTPPVAASDLFLTTNTVNERLSIPGSIKRSVQIDVQSWGKMSYKQPGPFKRLVKTRR